MPSFPGAEHVEAARMGDPHELSRLIEAVWPDAYRLAFAILGDHAFAQDAAQESCVILCRSIARLRGAEAFRVWFSRIVVREASRIKRRRSGATPFAAQLPETTDHAMAIDIWRALAALPQKLREVVVLRYFEDFSSREIASVLRIPDGTVRFRLAIARRRLRPLLGDGLELTAPASPRVRTHAV
jgi:RNA polymerase sigma-70 factor (ECF subfamily)